jgi:hypothetical protein
VPKCKVSENGISRNYFCEEKAVDHVRPRSTVDWPWTAAPSSLELGLQPLRCPSVLAKGWERGSGMRGTRWSAHQSSGGIEAAERQW